MTAVTTTQCLKVASLRKETGDETITLEKWLQNQNNVYVGRKGRIFIGSGANKRIFHFKGSKFGNPYAVKKEQFSLEESLNLYDRHLRESGLFDEIEELRGKNLGCFCEQKGPCHAKILASYLNEKE